jgi:hypothetical protein
MIWTESTFLFFPERTIDVAGKDAALLNRGNRSKLHIGSPNIAIPFSLEA